MAMVSVANSNIKGAGRSRSLKAFTPFTPLDLSPDLWLDASDTSTITQSGGSVSQWADKSGNNINFTQATGSNQPATGTRSQKSLNVIDFNGTSMYMTGGDVLDILSGDLTVLAVVKIDDETGINGIVGKTRYGSNANGRYAIYSDSNSGYFATLFQYGASTAVATYDPGASRTSPHVWGARVIRESSLTLWQNSSIVGTDNNVPGTTTLNSSDIWMIGAYQSTTGSTPPTAGTYLDGFIAEIVVFLRDLTDSEMVEMSNYLTTKWGI